MNKLELFLTGLFIVGTVVVMILIYFYNVRHKLVIESDIDDFEVETKKGEKAVVEADENFAWDLYESDLKHDYDKFVGYDIWKDKESAEKRITQLQKDFKDGVEVLKINMFESMLLIDRFADDVKLGADGVYKINIILLSEFLKDLTYDLELIEKIEELKDELDFSIETYEIDARKIFYIMRNASKLGFNNFNTHSQILLLAKNNKNITLDAEVVSDSKNGIGELELYIENFDSFIKSEQEHTEDLEDEKEHQKDELLSGIRNIMKDTKVYFEDGKRVIEYPSGQKIIKSNLWSVEVVEDEQEIINSKNKKDKQSTKPKQESFSDIMQESSVDEIMENQKKDKDNTANKIETNKNKKVKESEEKQDKKVEEKIKIKNEKISTASFYIENNKKSSIIGFLGKVKTMDDLLSKLKSLDRRNKKVLTILLLSIDAAKIISNNKEIYLIVEDKGNFFISYEWISMVFISLIENRNEFILNNGIVNKYNYTSNFSSGFMEIIMKFLEDAKLPLFKSGASQKFSYFKTSSGLYVSTALFELSQHAENLLNTYNSIEKMQKIKTVKIDKNSFKDFDGEKYNITFNTLL